MTPLSVNPPLLFHLATCLEIKTYVQSSKSLWKQLNEFISNVCSHVLTCPSTYKTFALPSNCMRSPFQSVPTPPNSSGIVLNIIVAALIWFRTSQTPRKVSSLVCRLPSPVASGLCHRFFFFFLTVLSSTVYGKNRLRSLWNLGRVARLPTQAFIRSSNKNLLSTSDPFSIRCCWCFLLSSECLIKIREARGTRARSGVTSLHLGPRCVPRQLSNHWENTQPVCAFVPVSTKGLSEGWTRECLPSVWVGV